MSERPYVCRECLDAMPDINWNHPCPHGRQCFTPEFVWRWRGFAWLKRPLPRGRRRFYEWRWEGLANCRWCAIGRFAFRVPPFFG